MPHIRIYEKVASRWYEWGDSVDPVGVDSLDSNAVDGEYICIVELK